MTKKITFVARDEYGWEVCERPFPAKQKLPDWWRSMSPYIKTAENPDGKKIDIKEFDTNATFKKCTPMLDALTSGYMIPLWADVLVQQHPEKGPTIKWKTSRDVFQVHGSMAHAIEPPAGFTNFVVKFLNYWIPKTPSGYSVLVTSPLGFNNLPLRAIPGIIDSDQSTLDILPPMWLKEGFEGIIEKGTPLVQLTPFKRENWEAEFEFLPDGKYQRIEDKNFRGTIVNHYIKNHWSKKTYN